MYKTKNDLPEKIRADAVAILNARLADSIDLMHQAKQAHWNVKGPTFIALHKLFDELAETVEGLSDEIAERATALGGIARGTLRQGASASRLPEFPHATFKDMAVVEVLAVRYADLAKTTREAIDKADELADKDTADLFTEVSRALDKALWLLEAHLQP